MKKYICSECGCQFDEPEIVEIDETIAYSKENIGKQERWCPCCFSERFDTITKENKMALETLKGTMQE